MTNKIAITLSQNGVKTVQDVADLANDELMEICPECSEQAAYQIIMAARKIAYNID